MVKQGTERNPALLDTDAQEQELLRRLQRFGLQKTRIVDLKSYLQAGHKDSTGNHKVLAQRAFGYGYTRSHNRKQASGGSTCW